MLCTDEAREVMSTEARQPNSRLIARVAASGRKNFVDRVGSDEDAFSSPTGSTSSISDAALLRAQRNQEVAASLIALENLFQEDFQMGLNQDSRNDVSAFFSMNFLRPLPVFSAEPNGHIIVTWRLGKESVVLRFKGGNAVDFAFATNRDGELTREWGSAHVMGFFDGRKHADKVVMSC